MMDLEKPARVRTSGSADRLPPHSIEAEQGILGCVLLDPGCLRTVVDRLAPAGEVFYDLRHQLIYRAMEGLLVDGTAVDLLTLANRLKETGHLEEVGGLAYLAPLPDTVPSAANLPYYLDIVLEKAVGRRLIRWGSQVVRTVYEFEGPVDALLAQTRGEYEALASLTVQTEGAPRFLKRPLDFEESFWKYLLGDEAKPPGVVLPTDFEWRVRLAETTLITGDDGCGKSTVLGYWSLFLAAAGLPVCVASFEVVGGQTLAMLARQLLGCGPLVDTEANRQRGIAALAWLHARYHIYDFTGIGDWREVLNTFRVASRRHGVKVFILDSVMRIGIPEDDFEKQRLAATSFENFAKEEGVHLLYVIHENKGDGKGKAKVRGSKLWTANAHNIIRIERNVGKAEAIARAEDAERVARERQLELEAWGRQMVGQKLKPEALAKLQDDLAAASLAYNEARAKLAKARAAWDTHFVLQKQRWPGSRQNASKKVWFDNRTLQLLSHLDDQPENLLARFTGREERIAQPKLVPDPGTPMEEQYGNEASSDIEPDPDPTDDLGTAEQDRGEQDESEEDV
jgi:hypothetical protein